MTTQVHRDEAPRVELPCGEPRPLRAVPLEERGIPDLSELVGKQIRALHERFWAHVGIKAKEAQAAGARYLVAGIQDGQWDAATLDRPWYFVTRAVMAGEDLAEIHRELAERFGGPHFYLLGVAPSSE